MKYNFEWDMTEKDWKQYMMDHKNRNKNAKGFYGCCRVGKLKADLQHTVDTDAWHPYTLVFCLDKDTGYGYTSNERPYDLLNNTNISIPVRARTFESFKKIFERNMIADMLRQGIKELDAPLETMAAWGH